MAAPVLRVAAASKYGSTIASQSWSDAQRRPILNVQAPACGIRVAVVEARNGTGTEEHRDRGRDREARGAEAPGRVFLGPSRESRVAAPRLGATRPTLAVD